MYLVPHYSLRSCCVTRSIFKTGKGYQAAGVHGGLQTPEGSGSQCLRTSVPKAIQGMVFGTKDLKRWVLGPSGNGNLRTTGLVVATRSEAGSRAGSGPGRRSRPGD